MFASTPRPVILAGLIVSAQALVGTAFVVALILRGMTGVTGQLSVGKVYGEAGYFAVVTAGVAVVAVGLLRGRRWSRSPAIVLQLLLLGIAWYLLGPSGRPEYGVPVGVIVITVLVLLFGSTARDWALGETPSTDEEHHDAAS